MLGLLHLFSFLLSSFGDREELTQGNCTAFSEFLIKSHVSNLVSKNNLKWDIISILFNLGRHWQGKLQNLRIVHLLKTTHTKCTGTHKHREKGNYSPQPCKRHPSCLGFCMDSKVWQQQRNCLDLVPGRMSKRLFCNVFLTRLLLFA